MITFDPEYGHVTPMRQLCGKTIATIEPVDQPNDGGAPSSWLITFTDGDQVQLVAHYGDSEVFWVRPTQ